MNTAHASMDQLGRQITDLNKDLSSGLMGADQRLQALENECVILRSLQFEAR